MFTVPSADGIQLKAPSSRSVTWSRTHSAAHPRYFSQIRRVQQHVRALRHVDDVLRRRQRLCDLLGGLQLPNLQHTRTVRLYRTRNQVGRLGLALRLDDGRQLLLLALLHDELDPLRLLLGHLLLLNGLAEVLAVAEVRDRHVVELDVELLRPRRYRQPDVSRHLVPLGQQRLGVVPGHHGLEHLVADRGQHTLVVVRPQLLVDPGQVLRDGPVQQPEADGDHLEIPGARRRVDDLRLGPDVVDVRYLEPRQVEVAAFALRAVAHAPGEAVEHHGALSAVDVHQTRAGHEGHGPSQDRELREPPQRTLHFASTLKINVYSVLNRTGRAVHPARRRAATARENVCLTPPLDRRTPRAPHVLAFPSAQRCAGLGVGLLVHRRIRYGLRQQVYEEYRNNVRHGTQHDEVDQPFEVLGADAEGVGQHRREVGADVQSDELGRPQEGVHARLDPRRAQSGRHDEYRQRVDLPDQLEQRAVRDDERRVRDPELQVPPLHKHDAEHAAHRHEQRGPHEELPDVVLAENVRVEVHPDEARKRLDGCEPTEELGVEVQLLSHEVE
ncbi:tyrosine-protein phosphatase Lar isoform X1 [Babesia caballi]|uniref:Tyrosine-protein phosphatase Lar isoform X1 n=1 Tax=Babesia caballi TaxID=5871 RepID=A0AAV4LZ17_BABCB|nr:tyrosine-protein phosphatase Lar isoform X1 [Babesia caballi]